MLRDPLGPLRVRWRDLAWLTPFLCRFALSATPSRVAAIADSLASLLQHAWSGYLPLIEACEAGDVVRISGELYVYETDGSFAGARPYHEMRRERGVSVEFLSGSQAREIEPALGSSVRHAAWLSQTRATSDPFVFTQRLADGFGRAGGTLLQARVNRLTVSQQRITALETTSGTLQVDGAVIAAGHESCDLLSPLGLHVPLRSERGHHLMLREPEVPLATPLVSGDHKFGLIPMAGGIRLVGASELARASAPADFSRIERLLGPAARLLPGLVSSPTDRWIGSRPAMPDSLPVLGYSPRWRNLLLAFGHGHLGLTLAGISGQLLAELATGRQPTADLTAFQWPRPAGETHSPTAAKLT
jgi:D-amino-acid dehydrogenase